MEITKAPQWIEVAKADDIEMADVQRCRVGDRCLAVFNLNGSFYATSDICTHA